MSKYYIVAQVWNNRKTEYENKTILETINRNKAQKKFDALKVDIDTPMVELYVEGIDYDTRLERKVCLERGMVERVVG